MTAPKDFWRVLVKPHKPWVIRATGVSIEIASYDLRKVGAADVARLRWTEIAGKERKELDASDCIWTQVAVTDAGLYLFEAKDDDAKILAALAGKPHRSSPPRQYKPTAQNRYRDLYITRDETSGEVEVCWGWDLPEGSECEDTCSGHTCVRPSGISLLDGNCTPSHEQYTR